MKTPTLFKHLLSLVLALSLGACATQPGSYSRATPEKPASSLAPLPEPVTSFAAVTDDGWLYVCGGHKGERHDYSAAKVSGAFHRLRLDDGATWQRLPDAPPAQGVPLVAHEGRLYRIGGMAARNQPEQKQDLYSMSSVLRYDVRRARLEEFAALPEPRSSHDAVVVDDKLYVGGGWRMSGGTNLPSWPDHALVFDLKNPRAGWSRIPQPFQRRALAMAAQDSRLYFIGGMDSDNKPTLAVEVLDLASAQWSKGPELPAGKFKGFSCSAITQAGRVYANTFQGDLLRLTTDGGAWEVVGRLQYPRLAHRLVTAGANQLIALGGEDGESKRPELELLTPSVKAIVSTPARTAAAH